MNYVKRFSLLIVALFLLSGCDLLGSNNTLTINFDTDGGNVIEQMTVDLSDARISIPTPVKEGYTFEGWYLEDDFETVFDVTTFDSTQSVTVYASWTTAVEVEVIFNVSGETYASQIVNASNSFELPDNPILPGYEFAGWYFEDTFDTEISVGETYTQNITLYAKFEYYILEDGQFDSQYDTPTETTESYEHILVLEKYIDIDGETDVTVLFDFKSMIISVAEIDANVGDMISFDATIQVQTIPIITVVQNIVVESSNNPTIKETFTGSFSEGIEGYGYRPFFMINEGYYSGYYNENDPEINGVDFKSGYEVYVNGFYADSAPESGAARYGVLVVPIEDDELEILNIYDEDIYPFEELDLSDTEMVAKIKTYFMEQSTFLSHEFNNSILNKYPINFYEANVSINIDSEYSEYFNTETNRLSYSDVDISLPFTVTVTLGNATETFPITVLLEGLDTYTMMELTEIDSMEYFIADVIYSSGNLSILYDGETMMHYYKSSFSESLLEGHSYIFTGTSFFFISDSTSIRYEGGTAISDLGETSNTYPEETLAWSELEEGFETGGLVVTLSGTLSIAALNEEVDVYVFSDGYTSIVLERFISETDDLYEYVESEGELKLFVDGYNDSLYLDDIETSVFYAIVMEIKEFEVVVVVEDPLEIALINSATDNDFLSLDDGTWDGIVEFAESNDLTYKYYTPTEVSDTAYLSAIELAVEGGASIIVAPGFLFESSVFIAQDLYPDVHFILIDGYPHSADYSTFSISDNTFSILFEEHEAGFLAGYAAVKEGYTNLGFTGGMAVPAVVKYGIGFIAGAYYAADELGIDISFDDDHYYYFGDFNPSASSENLAESWYFFGTEVIFCVAGTAGESVIAAAETLSDLEVMMIGVDIDQSEQSTTVLTSALKQVDNAVQYGLQAWLDGNFAGGSTVSIGAAEDAVGLPMDTSRFTTFTQADYDAVYALIVDGSIVVPSSYSELLTFLNDGTLDIPTSSTVEPS